MPRIKGFGKRKKVKVRVSEEDIYTIIKVFPIILLLIIGLLVFGAIGDVMHIGNVSSGWP